MGSGLVAMFAAAQSVEVIYERRELLGEAIAALGTIESRTLCVLLALRARIDAGPGGDADAARATAMANRLGVSVFELGLRAVTQAMAAGNFEEAIRLAKELHSTTQGDLAGGGGALNNMCASYVALGDIDGAVANRGEMLEVARRLRRSRQAGTALSGLATIAINRGDREEAAVHMAAAAGTPTVLVPQALMIEALRNADLASAQAHLRDALDAGVPPSTESALRMLVATNSRSEVVAREHLDVWAAWWRSPVSRLNPAVWLGALSLVGDGLIERGERELQSDVLQILGGYPSLRCLGGFTAPPSSADGLRGFLSLKLDRVDEANQHFRTGLEWASSPAVRFEVDAGRCLQGLAEVAERRGQHLEAMQHLDAAGALFAKHGAKLYLDQVIARKQILKA